MPTGGLLNSEEARKMKVQKWLLLLITEERVNFVKILILKSSINYQVNFFFYNNFSLDIYIYITV